MPLLLNIYVNDMIFVIEDTEITNFADDNADDNTLFVCDNTINIVITRLERDYRNLREWFKMNYLKANEDNFFFNFLKFFHLFYPLHSF